ncbi:MAG: leucine-rich repeat domain-containing protein, partial [Candidatus Thorarchaeota archaeon]
VISDVDEAVRSTSARILVERFPDESMDTLEWVLKTDLSISCIEVILESFQESRLRKVLETFFEDLICKLNIKNFNLKRYVIGFKQLFERRPLEQFSASELMEMYLNYRILTILETKFRLSETYHHCLSKNGYLDELDLNGIQIRKISDIDGLSKLTKLGSLELTQTGLTEISGLENLKELGSLNLSWNNITRIKGLEDLTELVDLDLSENQITEISGLKNLVNLRALNLTNNKIRRISGIETLGKLEYLYLGKNDISEISGLNNNHNLIEVFLNSNQITEIKGLKNQIKLRDLDLRTNKIKEIKGLRNLRNLECLDLEENQITKIKGIRKLKKILGIELYGNDISNEELANFWKKLEKKKEKRSFKEFKSSRLKSAKKLI